MNAAFGGALYHNLKVIKDEILTAVRNSFRMIQQPAIHCIRCLAGKINLKELFDQSDLCGTINADFVPI